MAHAIASRGTVHVACCFIEFRIGATGFRSGRLQFSGVKLQLVE